LKAIDLFDLAGKFRVVPETVLWRMQNLGIIDNAKEIIDSPEFSELRNNNYRSEYCSNEGLPEKFVRLAFQAYTKSQISRGKLAELLGASWQTLQKYWNPTASTRRRIIKGKSVLFDADMIIKAHEIHTWESIVLRYDVSTSEYICLNEVKYIKSRKTGNPVINLKNDYADTGKIKLLSATGEQIAKLSGDLSKKYIYGNQILDRIDPGEQTLLAILNTQPDTFFFCSGYGAAIIAAAALDLLFMHIPGKAFAGHRHNQPMNMRAPQSIWRIK
jgi:hypothetical protein